MFNLSPLWPLLLIAALLTACTQSSAPKQSNAEQFSSSKYNVVMSYPTSLKATHGFKKNYFMNTRWNPDAGQSVPGQGLLTLTLPKSNKLVTGELRLGASKKTKAVDNCALPEDGNSQSASSTVIDGVTFQRRDTRDAGMNHFLLRHAYRGIANGHCYAIDLVVDGTNPGVYPDDPEPPMTKKEAFQQLSKLLNGLSFSDSE